MAFLRPTFKVQLTRPYERNEDGCWQHTTAIQCSPRPEHAVAMSPLVWLRVRSVRCQWRSRYLLWVLFCAVCRVCVVNKSPRKSLKIQTLYLRFVSPPPQLTCFASHLAALAARTYATGVASELRGR